MIDFETEHVISLREARNLPWLRGRAGKPISLDSLHRWRLRGLRGVVLETVRIGGTIHTTVEALNRFVARLSVGDNVPVDSSHDRRRLAVADKKLDKAGI